jgi:thiol-disulfide isomerase/thioredoxin
MPKIMIATVGLLLAGWLTLPIGQAQEKAVEPSIVKYDGLKDVVAKNKGKVVVVDFWTIDCFPCKTKSLPHLVEIQKKWASKGLVTASVLIDNYEKQTADGLKVAAGRFLTRINATGSINLVIDKDAPFGGDKFRFATVPCIYVFDCRGKWTRFGGDESNALDDAGYARMDQFIEKLLDEK